MPDREVNTIKDLIYYQYSKVIARSAFSADDGKQAKSEHYGFIKKTFRELKDGTKSWSDITREDWQLVESDKNCIFCGDDWQLQKEHLVPKSLRIKAQCRDCPKIQSIHNQVWACKACNVAKSTMGLYEFYRFRNPGEKKFYDLIPPLAEKKYLKTIYSCHECSKTLNKGDIDGDDQLSVLDIDCILHYAKN